MKPIPISRRAQKVDASGIRKVFELAAKIQDPINLSIGQPDFDVPDSAKDAAIAAIKQGLNRYTLTQGAAELRQAIRERLAQSHATNYDADQIFVTSGVSGGLMLALLCLVDVGDEIVFFDPYFVMYKHLVNLLDGKPVIVDSHPDFRIRYDRLKAAITPRTKAIILNSPANPTGVVYNDADLEAAVRVAREHDLLIVADEIYDGFCYDAPFRSVASRYQKTLVLGGFSKTYAMTGWRLGYAAGPSDLIAQMIKLQQYSFVCAPAPFQYAAVKAMELNMSHYFDEYRAKRDFMYEALKDDFDLIKPNGAFYMYPGIRGLTDASGNWIGSNHPDASKFCEMALAHKVLIIPGNVFSERNSHFRISFAASDETLKQGADFLVRTARDFAKR